MYTDLSFDAARMAAVAGAARLNALLGGWAARAGPIAGATVKRLLRSCSFGALRSLRSVCDADLPRYPPSSRVLVVNSQLTMPDRFIGRP